MRPVSALLLVTLVLSACSGDENPTDPGSEQLPRGLNIVLTGTGSPYLVNDTANAVPTIVEDGGNARRPSSPRWSTSDPSVVIHRGGGVLAFVGRGTATITVEAEGQTASVELQVQGVLHNEPPRGRVTWMVVDTPHVVPAYFDDVGSPDTTVLTIEPGSVVRFREGAGLEFGLYEPGRLVIPEGPGTVIMEGDSAETGHWVSIHLRGPGRSELRNVVFRNCGREKSPGDFQGCLRAGNFGHELLVGNVTIEGAEQVGLTMGGDTRFHPDSEDLTITGTTGHPATIFATALKNFPTGSFTGNARDEIEIASGAVLDSTVIRDPGVPWRMTEGIVVPQTSAGTPGRLVIEPGQRFIMEGGVTGIRVLDGSLIVGEAGGLPVTFEDAGNGWRGIEVDQGQRAEFYATTLGGCGVEIIACLEIKQMASVRFQNLTINDSRSIGLRTTAGGTVTQESSGLTITGSADVPVDVPAGEAASIPAGTYADNGADVIRISGGALGQSATWSDPGVPYRLIDGLFISSLEGGDPVLTLLPGVTLEFPPGRPLSVGEFPDAGNLVATGTEDAPVVMRSFASDSAGSWVGVILGEWVDSRTRLEHVHILNAGGAIGRRGSAILVRVDNGNLLQNSLIQNARGCGMRLVSELPWPTDYTDPTLGNAFVSLGGAPTCLAGD